MPRRVHPSEPQADAAALTEVLQFMRALWAVVHALQRASKRMEQEVGVTGPQRLVLRVVGLFPGMSAGELAAILHVHPSTLTGVLQRLIAQRLVARGEHEGDRRRAVLSLTTLGERVNAVRRGTVEAAVRGVLARVAAAERAATERVLTRIADGLAAPDRPPRPAVRSPAVPSMVATHNRRKRLHRKRRTETPRR
jgi:MarR family transcriptional regulator, organic hydroperoxide resistance regulator